MARPPVINVQEVVSRELTRLNRPNMPILEFLALEELSEAEKNAFKVSLGQKSPFLYVDGFNFEVPVAMVGTFVSLRVEEE